MPETSETLPWPISTSEPGPRRGRAHRPVDVGHASGTRAAPSGPELFGRGRECARIVELLSALRAGHGGALVLRGEPGIGKSALLAWTTSRATGCAVVSAGKTAHVALEPYGLVASLLRARLHVVENLEYGDRRALAPLLRGGRSATDPMRLAAALVAWLSAMADGQPVLVVVDDVHRADVSSLDVLASAVPRLGDDAVAFLFAQRWNDPCPLDPLDLPCIELGGLDLAGASELLADRVVPEVARQLTEHTAGNPLALLALAGELDTEERAGRRPLEVGRTSSLTLDATFLDRVTQLPERARRLLEIASADDTFEVSRLLLVGRELGLGKPDLDALVEREFIRVDPAEGSLTFVHRLLRAALYRSLEERDRRSAHLRIAGTLRRHDDLARRAWHLAAAACGPDELAAEEMARAGRLALAKAGYGVAADAFERSAELSASPDDKARRLMEAGTAAWLSGRVERGRSDLLDALVLASDPRLRADVVLAMGRSSPHSYSGAFSETHAGLVSAADAVRAVDPLRSALLLALAVLAALAAAELSVASETADRALRLTDDPEVQLTVKVMRAMCTTLRGGQQEAMVEFRAFAGWLTAAGPSPTVTGMAEYVAIGLCAGEDYGTAGSVLEHMIDFERRRGALGMLALTLAARSELHWRTGRWLAAFADAHQASVHARETGQAEAVLGMALAALCRVESALGRADGHAHGEEALDLVGSVGGFLAHQCHALLGFCGLAEGKLESALHWLVRAREEAQRHGFANPAIVPWHAELVEVADALGERALARSVADELVALAPRLGIRGWRAIAARCRGIVADGTGSVWFEDALTWHTQGPLSFDTARTLLAYGTKLRTCGQGDGVPHLDAALGRFEELGAFPWMRRTLALLPWGPSTHDSGPGVGELSARELEVALAAAEGKTARAIASELSLSPRTVEFHLSAAYRKLHVHNRVQLVNRLHGGSGWPPEHPEARCPLDDPVERRAGSGPAERRDP